MQALRRAYRTYRVAWAAFRIWSMYKLPNLIRRRLGRPEKKRTEEETAEVNQKAANLLLDLALDLRGVIIKTCQVIATRSDVFPPSFIETLKQCHDRVPSKKFRIIRKVVETEMGKSLSEVFDNFENQPIASASLAQVHKATLKDGREVAVKVQYPDIERIVITDLGNIRRACRVYEHFDKQPLELMPLVKEFTEHIGYELDFVREAESANTIRKLLSRNKNVKIPEIYEELCTRRLIIMELVGGTKITEKEELIRMGLRPADVMQDLMHIYVTMILAAGFFQADPHPGNLMVKPGGQIIVLDFGLAKKLPDGFGLALFDLMFSMMTRNDSAMVRAFQKLGFETKTGDTKTFTAIAHRMMRKSNTGKFEGEFTEEMTGEMFDAIREDPVVTVPGDFVLVGRVFSLLSGIAHTLGSQANVLQAMGAAPPS